MALQTYHKPKPFKEKVCEVLFTSVLVSKFYLVSWRIFLGIFGSLDNSTKCTALNSYLGFSRKVLVLAFAVMAQKYCSSFPVQFYIKVNCLCFHTLTLAGFEYLSTGKGCQRVINFTVKLVKISHCVNSMIDNKRLTSRTPWF